MGERESSAGFIGLLAVGVGVCCGLPLLASIGVLGAVAGVSVGSWLLIVVGVSVAGIGLWRWRHRSTAECEILDDSQRTEATRS